MTFEMEFKNAISKRILIIMSSKFLEFDLHSCWKCFIKYNQYFFRAADGMHEYNDPCDICRLFLIGYHMNKHEKEMEDFFF